jgi:hypothetical protein
MTLADLISDCERVLKDLDQLDSAAPYFTIQSGQKIRGPLSVARAKLQVLEQDALALGVLSEPPALGAIDTLTAAKRWVKSLGAWAVGLKRSAGGGNSAEGEVPKKSGKRRKLVERALAVLIENPTWTKKQIADELECHEKSLSRQPAMRRLDEAIAAMEAGRNERPKGSKYGGQIEAYDK